MKVTIDGKEFEAKQGETVLQLALRNNIYIPHFCYHPELKVAGSCRMCLIELALPQKDKEGNFLKNEDGTYVVKLFPRLKASCNEIVAEGVSVITNSERLIKARKGIMEFLLLNHPLDCPVCDQAGECTLQDYAYDYGQDRTRFIEDKIVQPKKDAGERIYLYSDRCILCSRCLRFEKEISGNYGLTILDRGAHSEIDIFPDKKIDHLLSVNLVDICPVGAFKSKDFLFKQRVWFLKTTESICPGCSKGCNININHNDNIIYRIKPRENKKVNQCWMCDIGREAYKWLYSRERLNEYLYIGEKEKIKSTASDIIDITSNLISENKEKVLFIITPFASLEELNILSKLNDVVKGKVLLLKPAYDKEVIFPKFRISADRTPNMKGVEKVFAGKIIDSKEIKQEDLKVVIDHSPFNLDYDSIINSTGKIILFTPYNDHPLKDKAKILAPAKLWAEKSGSFINADNIKQTFEPAVFTAKNILDEEVIFTGIHKKIT